MTDDFERKKFEGKITDLLNLSELYLDFALGFRKLFEEFYDNEKNIIRKQKILSHPITNNIILHANSYLFLSINSTHSLLKNNSGTEVSFSKYFNKFGKTQGEIEDARKLYKDSLLDQVRDKIIAHKDLKNIGDPGGLAAILVHKRFFDSADQINTKLNKIVSKNFKNVHVNNPLLDLCERGLKDTLNYYREILGTIM
jgi:phosphomannomutase